MSTSPEPSRSADEIPPHAPLTTYYGDDPRRERYVRDLFDKTAHHYNTIEKIFGNAGLWYRRFSTRRAGMGPGMTVLDVAMGTGAVAQGALKNVGPAGRVFGCDPSTGMIREARKVFHGPVTRGVAERLPFATASFDFVTMGIALRHVADLIGTFREYNRVLKRGGKLWILESHVPESRLGHWLTKLVWAKLVPGLTLLFTRSRDAKLLMDYYWDTVEKCVAPETIVEALTKADFEEPRAKLVVPGAFIEYTGRKARRSS
jgi:demethylmenaquinone methyltransferase/2-methoxy-6-polyprenyl-1,4-benzoquinol methylase